MIYQSRSLLFYLSKSSHRYLSFVFYSTIFSYKSKIKSIFWTIPLRENSQPANFNFLLWLLLMQFAAAWVRLFHVPVRYFLYSSWNNGRVRICIRYPPSRCTYYESHLLYFCFCRELPPKIKCKRSHDGCRNESHTHSPHERRRDPTSWFRVLHSDVVVC